MENKVIITDSQYDVNDHLSKGWTVKTVVAQHMSTGLSVTDRGKFCFVLERAL